MGKQEMVILIPVFIGLYLILAVGYFKMVRSAVPEIIEEAPIMSVMFSAFWPLALVYTLLKEAIT